MTDETLSTHIVKVHLHYSDTDHTVIPIYHVKDFIQKLKENLDNMEFINVSGNTARTIIQDEIDKLAGDALIHSPQKSSLIGIPSKDTPELKAGTSRAPASGTGSHNPACTNPMVDIANLFADKVLKPKRRRLISKEAIRKYFSDGSDNQNRTNPK